MPRGLTCEYGVQGFRGSGVRTPVAQEYKRAQGLEAELAPVCEANEPTYPLSKHTKVDGSGPGRNACIVYNATEHRERESTQHLPGNASQLNTTPQVCT